MMMNIEGRECLALKRFEKGGRSHEQQDNSSTAHGSRGIVVSSFGDATRADKDGTAWSIDAQWLRVHS